MPTNWDKLLNWDDVGFNPTYNQEPNPFQSPTRPQMQMPEYDFTPMRRYKDYLGTEPLRENYQPGKFRNVLNSLSAGFESMDTNLGRGAQLYDALTERDYDKAYKSWAGRANKYKTDVDLENTRYKTASADYDRAEDNRRQWRSVDIQDRNADTAERRLQLAEKAHEDAGFQLVDGPDGKKIGVRIRGGQTEQQPTEIPNSNLTAEQRIQQFNAAEKGRNDRFRGVSGNAALAARTSRENTDKRISFSREEGQADRDSREWIAGIRPVSRTGTKPVTDVPSNTNTAPKLLGVYPEFDDPKLVGVRGEQFVPVGLETSDPEEFKRIMRDKSTRLGIPPAKLLERWEEFKRRATPLAVRSQGAQ